MLTPRHGTAYGTINGIVYVAGGGPTGGFALSNANEAFSFTAPRPLSWRPSRSRRFISFDSD